MYQVETKFFKSIRRFLHLDDDTVEPSAETLSNPEQTKSSSKIWKSQINVQGKFHNSSKDFDAYFYE